MSQSTSQNLRAVLASSYVYHPAFAGSYSLKSVLPALVPEMTYEGMDVADGQAAGLVWNSIVAGECSDAERQRKRKALLEYCGQDTFAMVKIVEALRERTFKAPTKSSD
jgi:hypothetical protein